MATEPKMDFRYVDEAGVEIEAFKVTKGARWASQDWPNWLQTQGSVNELNKVYTDPADPNRLFINLEAGRFGIEDDAYLIFEGGALTVRSGGAFEEQFTKVVPIPPRVLDEESLAGFEQTHKIEDGVVVKLDLEPGEVLELAAEGKLEYQKPELKVLDAGVTLSHSTLRPKVEIALEMMLDGNEGDGIIVLRNALSDETEWCNCAPGQCQKLDRWGCRESSPLVQS